MQVRQTSFKIEIVDGYRVFYILINILTFSFSPTDLTQNRFICFQNDTYEYFQHRLPLTSKSVTNKKQEGLIRQVSDLPLLWFKIGLVEAQKRTTKVNERL